MSRDDGPAEALAPEAGGTQGDVRDSTGGWEPIDGFRSPAEYERFRAWLAQRVEEGVAERVPVHFAGTTGVQVFEEWYRCTESGQVWMLLWPDGPSRGAFVPRGDAHSRDARFRRE